MLDIIEEADGLEKAQEFNRARYFSSFLGPSFL